MLKCLLLCPVLLLMALSLGDAPGQAAGGEPVFVDNFEEGNNWTPLPGVQLGIARLEGQGSCLRVKGEQEGGWNYARTSSFHLTPGMTYRVTASVLTERIEPRYPPFLKVEFTARKGSVWDYGRALGRAGTSRYDLSRGGWQRVEGEFAVPKAAQGGWIALEKGTNRRVAVDAYIADVMVVEIEEFTELTKLRFEEVPEPLRKSRLEHPRLHMTKERIAELKESIRSDQQYAALFEGVRRCADTGVRRGAPDYVLDDRHSGSEQLWQRPVGNMMPHLAIVYLLTGEQEYLEAARKFMTASCGYKTWGLGRIDGLDLAAGHQLYGLALCYDWLYHDLDEDTKRMVRECLLKRGRFMLEAAASEQVWWHDAYLQNHQWVNMTGLAAAGLALYGEAEDVDGWIKLPLSKFKETMASLGPDGASHEGVPYWSYGLEYMLKFMDLARDLLDEDLFRDNAWFRNTAYFRLYSGLPKNNWRRRSSLMTYADGPRYDWYGPDYMLRRLAREYRDGHAQWLADALDEANLCGSEARFLNLLWFDPTVKPEGPETLPAFRHFDDMGLVYMRSDWSGDESLCSFKCGPHIGHYGLEKFPYDPGGGHVHPDAGAFQIFAHGDWLIVDDGYTFKTTETQNTLLVNGIGQEGEGRSWFDGGVLCREKRGAAILNAQPGTDVDFVIGDATQAYKKQAGLKKFLRHVYFVKPSCWVIVDEIEAARPSTFELFFHADYPFQKTGSASYEITGSNGGLRITTLLPGNVSAEAFKQELRRTSGRSGGATIDALRVWNTEKTSEAVFVTVLHSYPAKSPLRAEVSIEKKERETWLTVKTPQRLRRFKLDLERQDPACPALTKAD